MTDQRLAGHEHAVVIAGRGPTGLMLGGVLALAGISSQSGIAEALTTWFGSPMTA